IALLRLLVRYDGLDLGGVERVEDRIALLALVRPFSRPLRVLLRLRPGAVGLDRGKLKLLALGGEHAGPPVAGMPGGATAHGLIDHVDDVALLYEILGPSPAPIRRAHPVGRGLSGAVDEHERIGPALILRRHYLDVSLALHNLLAGLADVFSANIEIAPLPD